LTVGWGMEPGFSSGRIAYLAMDAAAGWLSAPPGRKHAEDFATPGTTLPTPRLRIVWRVGGPALATLAIR
jgi:hypothetical protein